MDRDGGWRLAPAYDVTWAWSPGNRWLETINGKRDGFTVADLREVGKLAGLARGRAESILAEITDVVASWPSVAAEVSVEPQLAQRIADSHRLALPRS
ncbi:MAG TPA: hypothetical protein VGP17_02570 [Solirubrobacteraceae bacterium]|jgi:serine/threonine-protein kinase HipA|nr:hypothetical protein [Solirubrobacteraceae bacterium]